MHQDPGRGERLKAKTRKHYTDEFRANAVRKMNAPGCTVQELAAELGLSPSLLFRWRRGAGSRSDMSKQESAPRNARRPQDWTSAEKLSTVLESLKLGEEQLGGFIRQRGLHKATLDEWRETVMRGATAELDGSHAKPRAAADARRIRELERDLLRKEKALAETAVLLVLKKKVHDLLGDEDEST